MKNKMGRWRNDEIDFINKHIHSMSPEEIAYELKRDVESVIKYKEKNFGNITRTDIKDELRHTPEWIQLQAELTDEELKYFEHRFSKVLEQFVQDILPTEETQIFHLIKFEILMSRNMQDRKKAIERQKEIQRNLSRLRKNAAGEEDRAKIEYLQDEERSTEIAASVKSGEYVKLQEKHEAILKSLKSTREQRIKTIEGRKKNWIDIIRNLEEKDFRDGEAKHLDYMKRAILKERKKFGEFHEYGPGIVDKPFLNADTV